MKVLQYAKTENFIRPHASGLMVNNLPAGERYIKIPWLAGEECESSMVAVGTVLDWSNNPCSNAGKTWLTARISARSWARVGRTGAPVCQIPGAVS